MATTMPNDRPINPGILFRFGADNAEDERRRQLWVDRIRRVYHEETRGGTVLRHRHSTAAIRARNAGLDPPIAYAAVPLEAPSPDPLDEYLEDVLEDNLDEPDEVLLRRMVDAVNTGPPPLPRHTQYDERMWTQLQFEVVRMEIGLQDDLSPQVSQWLGRILRNWVERQLLEAEEAEEAEQ